MKSSAAALGKRNHFFGVDLQADAIGVDARACTGAQTRGKEEPEPNRNRTEQNKGEERTCGDKGTAKR